MKERKDKPGMVDQVNRNIIALAGMLAECADLVRETRTAVPAPRRP
jgi:hypothetical protein